MISGMKLSGSYPVGTGARGSYDSLSPCVSVGQ
jgi:hypothetical protein